MTLVPTVETFLPFSARTKVRVLKSYTFLGIGTLVPTVETFLPLSARTKVRVPKMCKKGRNFINERSLHLYRHPMMQAHSK